jgi:choline dehydrogenase-like flavoprotein
MAEAVIIGSGPAGSIAAHELAAQGWSVTVLERGRNLRPGFGDVESKDLETLYASDEVKTVRRFGFPQPQLEPLTGRSQSEAADGRAQRDMQAGHAALQRQVPALLEAGLHAVVGPRPGGRHPGRRLADHLRRPRAVLRRGRAHHRCPGRRHPNAGAHAGTVAALRAIRDAAGADQLCRAAADAGRAQCRLAALPPYPAAVNSNVFDGRPACNSCGLCSSFGCPINARGDAMVSYLNPAVRTGRVRVIERALVSRIDTTPDGRRATDVRYFDRDGVARTIRADKVLIAASPVQTARLLLLSASSAHPLGLGNRSDQVGRNMMFHYFTIGAALYARDIHSLRAQSTTVQVDDLMGPFTGPEVRALGVPYIKGGLIQVGGAAPLLQEAYQFAGFGLPPGQAHKTLMQLGLVRSRVAAIQFVGEDLPQANNRVDLDPTVRDWRGLPVPRVTWAPHLHERAGAAFTAPKLLAMLQASPEATGALVLPDPLLSDRPTLSAHHAGTARMGENPDTSVCDRFGRLHEVDNVHVVDGSLFPTFPGFNPTLSILANSLRIARAIGQGIT